MPTARDRERFLKSLLIIVVGLPFVFLFWLQSERTVVKPPPHGGQSEVEDGKAELARQDSPKNESTQAGTLPPDSVTKESKNVESPASVDPPPPTIDQLLAESRHVDDG